MRSLFDQTEFSRMRNQDSTVRVVGAEVARARDLRDVGILYHRARRRPDGLQRDHFLRDLVGQSGDGRLESQDAMAPDEMTPRQKVSRYFSYLSLYLRAVKQQAFIAHVMARSGAGRLDGQDFPVPVDDKLAQRRESFINNIMSASSSGRLTSQDSLPPTPRANTDSKEDPFELVTVQDFLSGRGCSENSSRNGSSSVTADDRSPTALRKIAGMVRRSSLGLGPKATADSGRSSRPSTMKADDSLPDLTHMAYVAEHQEHLKVVQIMLHGSGISSKDTFQLETPRARSAGDDVREAIVSSKQDATLSLRIPLPSPVLPGQSKSFANQDLHLEAKLFDWQSSTSDNMSSFNTVILTATDMRELRPKALCCATCERRIADLSSSTVFKDLPSEHWPEMMEVWICHADPTFTARIARQTKDGFWPTKGTVLVGGSYLLVDGGQTKKHNLHAADITVSLSSSSFGFIGLQEGHRHSPTGGLVTEALSSASMRAKLLQVSLVPDSQAWAEALDGRHASYG